MSHTLMLLSSELPVKVNLCISLSVYNQVPQSRVEIEDYFVAYVDQISLFKALNFY